MCQVALTALAQQLPDVADLKVGLLPLHMAHVDLAEPSNRLSHHLEAFSDLSSNSWTKEKIDGLQKTFRSLDKPCTYGSNIARKGVCEHASTTMITQDLASKGMVMGRCPWKKSEFRAYACGMKCVRGNIAWT